MDNYVGKICPFCKTEIKEGDAVKVCPACRIPHHQVCWEENKGCTTFGCSEQHYEAQETNPTDVCPTCGFSLSDDQIFCPKCGTPKGGVKKNICDKCGTELQEGQEFCPKCGQKARVNKANEANKKNSVKLIIAAVTSIAAIVAIITLSPRIFLSVDDLCAEGNYAKAYEKADKGKKLEIRAENAAAVQSAFSADNLKDPSSFSLRNAYYNEDVNDDGDTTKQLVLYISGANSYGANVSSYWLYTWDNEENKWSYFASVSDLEEEEYSSYDDDDESTEKLVNNLARIIIESTMDSGIELNKDAIKRINNMFENDTLDDIELLEINENN